MYRFHTDKERFHTKVRAEMTQERLQELQGNSDDGVSSGFDKDAKDSKKESTQGNVVV